MENLSKLLPLAVLPIVGLGASALMDLENPEAAGLALGATVVAYGIQSYLERSKKQSGGAKKAEKASASASADSEFDEDEEDLAKKDSRKTESKKKPKKKKVVKANSANSNAEESKRKRLNTASTTVGKKDGAADLPLTLGGDNMFAQNPQLAQQQQLAQEKAAAAAKPAAAEEAGKKKKKKKGKKAAAAGAGAEEDEQKGSEPASNEDGWTQIKSSRRSRKAEEAAIAAGLPVPGSDDPAKPAAPAQITVSVQVSAKQHGKIIGDKGATLQLLQLQTNTRIEVPKRESNSEIITVSGTDLEGVQSCRKAIEQLATLGFSHITHPGTTSGDVSIPVAKHGGIIGKGGNFIKAIQEATGTQVRMPEKAALNPNKISIVGPKDGIKTAKDAIRALARDGYSALTHPEWIKDELDFPRESFPTLIGHKGQTIKSIQGDTRTRINIPDKDDEIQTVSVVGLPADVQRACVQIMRLLEPPPAPVFEEPAPGDTWGSALPMDDGW